MHCPFIVVYNRKDMLEKKYAILVILLVAAIPVTLSTFTSSTLALSICTKSLTCASTNAFAPFSPCCVLTADSGTSGTAVNINPNSPPVHISGGNPTALVNPGGHTQATAGSLTVHTP